jgi:serine/threonine protein kinase
MLKLVHPNLKSPNVLLVGWKLSDFGTVRRSLGLGADHTMAVIGTLGYMPP